MLSVALGSQALSLTSILLEDLASEVRGDDTDFDDDDIDVNVGNVDSDLRDPATFDLAQSFTAKQRSSLVLSSVPLVQLLFQLAIISYRKSCHLRCASSGKHQLMNVTK